MNNGTISLILMNGEERDDWIKKITYEAYSPRHASAIKFIGASQISDLANKWDVSGYRRIEVSETSRVSDVVRQARQCYPGYDEEFREADVSMFDRFELLIFRPMYAKRGSTYGHKVSYHLYFPALSKQELNGATRISDLRLVDDDLIVIEKRINKPAPAILAGVSSFREFQDVVWGNEDARDPMLLATLLYTDEDMNLAKYVREHFDQLHQMSGPRVITYVVERAPNKEFSMWSDSFRPEHKESTFAASLFWKKRLDALTYRAWGLLGWTRSAPVNRAAAYEIARRLGIYPDQLPCLAVFDKTGQAEKIVFPVVGDYTNFFRTTFSNIQRVLDLGPGLDISIKWKLDRERGRLFDKLRGAVSQAPIDSDGRHTVYNFYGQTVFVNHSIGSPWSRRSQNGREDQRRLPIMKGKFIFRGQTTYIDKANKPLIQNFQMPADPSTSASGIPESISATDLILFLAADPSDTVRLRLGEEIREIQEKLQLAMLRSRFRLEQRMSVRVADISQALLDIQPRIVHFSGHGSPQGALCFENEMGQSQFVQPDALAALFEQFADQVNCVLLNACYSEDQAKAIAEHINYVIGMNGAIEDKAATAFAVGFYQALGAGRKIEDAYKLGCVQIRMQGIPEYLTPVLLKKRSM